MANRFQNPFPEFYDTTVAPREGARLFFYESNSSTKLDTYSDASLSTPNTNPIVLDENGRPEVAIFLKNQDYKVILAAPGVDDPPGDVIWTADPVRASDWGTMVLFKTGSGNPSGVVAGTAGSSGVLPTMYWDYTNSILYVCTATGTTLTAVWTALNSTSAGSFFAPAGRLTLTSGQPVMSSDASAATAIYYTPHIGNAVPIYNGSTFVMRTFSELTLTLHSSHATSTIYDVFIFDDNGTLTIGTGPAWATNTAGSGARGSGAGTSELTRITGFYTNAVSITARNGSTTYSVGANLGLFLGSFINDSGAAGQVSCRLGFGQNRTWGLWNAFNREPIRLKVGDATASWAYSTNTLRPQNNDTGNKASILVGLAEEHVDVSILSQLDTTAGARGGQVAVGWNSTTAQSGAGGEVVAGSNAGAITDFSSALYSTLPAIGVHDITFLERGTGSATTTWYGGEDDSHMLVKYKG